MTTRPSRVRIYATDVKTGQREEIDDFYWFEENFVHNFGGRGLGVNYKFDISVDGIIVRVEGET